MLLLTGSVLRSQERPKLGLTLSGGGAKGFAHIGVLKVLEELNLPIDYISGTSMGSVIGGLYAIGYRAADLEALALRIDWDDMFSDRSERRFLGMPQKYWDSRYTFTLELKHRRVNLPSGIIAGHKIYNLLNRLTLAAQPQQDFHKFPIPFTCIATDIVTGEAVVLDHGNIAEAIRASMAIPSVFTAIRIDGRLLVDGGLVRNFPVADVRKMGADRVIGVDVSTTLLKEDRLRSFLDIMNQAINFQIVSSTEAQRAQCDYLLQPDIADFSVFDFDRVPEIIAAGEKVARAHYAALQALADTLAAYGPPSPPEVLPQIDSLYITRVETRGLRTLTRSLVIAELGIRLPARITLDQLERGIEHIYSLQMFDRVGYSIEDGEEGSTLLIRLAEKSPDLFRIGIHYDSKTDASLMINTTFRNLSRYGSILSLDAKLGGDPQFDARYYLHLGFPRGMGMRLRANYNERNTDTFQDEERIARIRFNSSVGEGLWGTVFSSRLMIGAGVRGEYVTGEPSIAPLGYPSITEKLLLIFATLTLDTYDKSVYPSSGYFLQISAEHSDRDLLNKRDFQRYYLDARALLPLHRQVSFLSQLFLGSSGGEGLPLHYQFALGGMDKPIAYPGKLSSFLGLKAQERLGPHAQFLQLGFQYEFLKNKYAQLRWNAGNTFAEWQLDLKQNRFITGWGLTVGARTLLGPVEFTLMSGNRRVFLSHLNIGYKF
ncbi:MAG: patatin-like phospholipase family protein [Calditrichaeota bacterium]|nr:patatin-like phospholipase family protein [Calditrichota bacterium]